MAAGVDTKKDEEVSFESFMDEVRQRERQQ